MNYKGWALAVLLGIVCCFLVLWIGDLANGQADPRIWKGMGTVADINSQQNGGLIKKEFDDAKKLNPPGRERGMLLPKKGVCEDLKELYTYWCSE